VVLLAFLKADRLDDGCSSDKSDRKGEDGECEFNICVESLVECLRGIFIV